MNLIQKIYVCSRDFPREEMYGLTAQLRRAAVSIAANIAEGMGRKHRNDTIRFLHISRGSVYEVETLLSVAVLTKALSESDFEHLVVDIDRFVMILSGLISYYENAEHLK